ncbi:MAG: MarR family winged helix-turn-helix transcriptional regulator [Bacteroidia bacterium]|nr:MarR family winged helix-turn-helix transcriptional regulator [Bacteroidia bacterium]MCX7764154.1 MarR family winged helix-turn-helix transcriptional regulator [Bacteroidia bacterium]MDW8057448.1 MarR family winged helix-turn-helix transcriptional regulator [Bacteroidia bacterium]
MSREESLLWSDLGFSLLRVYTTLQREEKGFAAQYQLGTPHVEVLYLLSRLEEKAGRWIAVSRLYPYLPITQPAVGRILKHLAYWRYVELQRDKSDRRRLMVRLLLRGHKLLEKVEEMRAQTLRRFFPHLSPAQLKGWVEVLRSCTFAATDPYHVESSMGIRS